MQPKDIRIAKLAFTIGTAFPDHPVTLERAHHVTWVLITLGGNRVAVCWSGERRFPYFEICTPESYRGYGLMDATAYADSPQEVAECLKLYAQKGNSALFSRELDRSWTEHQAHPERSVTMAQMKRSLRDSLRRAKPYVDTTPPSLKKTVENKIRKVAAVTSAPVGGRRRERAKSSKRLSQT